MATADRQKSAEVMVVAETGDEGPNLIGCEIDYKRNLRLRLKTENIGNLLSDTEDVTEGADMKESQQVSHGKRVTAA